MIILSSFFSSELTSSSMTTPSSDLVWPHLLESKANYIDILVSDEEIRHALWSLKPFKSPVLTDSRLVSFEDFGLWLATLSLKT